MSLISDKGYLEGPYLNRASYLGGDALDARPMQVLRVINGTAHASDLQANRTLTEAPSGPLWQVRREIQKINARLFEVRRTVNGAAKDTIWQVFRAISKIKALNVAGKRGRILHTVNADLFYLAGSYLADRYLTPGFLAWVPFQVGGKLTKTPAYEFQIEKVITDSTDKRFQVSQRIDQTHDVLFQINRVQFRSILYQINRVLYNTKRLRVLLDFASRGVTGNNWTASSTATGDFAARNLNTDIVEQCWRSNGSKVVSLTCDTEVTQGVFVDTIAILGHNLTRSATVEVQASNSPTFAVYDQFFMTVNRTANMYYVAPKAPTQSYRYWRFAINDTTNTAPYLQIGTIVFGNSILMVANDITDTVRRSTRHFSDKVQTEGFTNVSNDRSIKYGLGVEFRSISYDGADYTNLRRIFDTARTSLKCLWIPTPEYPERFAVFGKLSAIPEEQHVALGPKEDYVSLNVDVDESL